MLKKILLLVVVGFCSNAFAAGFEILVIQRDSSAFSQRFFAGFTSNSNEKITVLKVTENNGKALAKEIKRISPDLVLSIGDLPIYTAIAELPSIPFIVANLYSIDLENRSNVILVEDRIPIFEELSMLKLMFPNLKTVGTMYNPDYAEKAYKELDQAGKRLGIKVAPIKVSSENDIGTYVSAFKGKVDAFYLISDNTTTNPKAIESLFNFTKENKIPVLSTQYNHIFQGAILSISSDPIILGSRAWDRAFQTMSDGKVSNRKIYLSANELSMSISVSATEIYKIESKKLVDLTKQATEKGFSVTYVK